jgi:hypothetical protein
MQNRAPPRLISNNAKEEIEIETGSDVRNENHLEEGKKSGETEKINSLVVMSENVMHLDHNDQEGFDPGYVDQEDPTEIFEWSPQGSPIVFQLENEGGDTEKEVSTRTPSKNTEILPENVPIEEPVELNIEREEMQA